MSYSTARLMTLPLLMIGSTWFIARYRAVGVIVSLFLGWAILLTVYKYFPAPAEVWDEDREEIHFIAPMLMIIWCFPVWAFVSVVSSLKKRGKVKQWIYEAMLRAQRRRSHWNLILIPLSVVAIGATWYGLFRVVWAFHRLFYPHHELHDFWRRGISFSSFVPSFLMLFAIAPGALCTGLAIANCIAWLIRPARRTFNAEAAAHPETDFRNATRKLLLYAVCMVSIGLMIALCAAYFLRSLK